jgi:hypothetical protein
MAKKMLEKRNIPFVYRELTQKSAEEFKDELPFMLIDEKKWEGKSVLIKIREMENER